jgi:GH24 family phage-related lysozyme (muramidase)
MRNVAPPKTCDEPEGPSVMPKEVSQALIDRMMGKSAGKDKDPGEGCREQPYVAGIPESVCTIGFGHQITERSCPVLRKDNDQPLTAEEKRTKKFQGGVKTGSDQPPSTEEKKESKSDQPPGAEEKKQTATDQPPGLEEKKEGEVKTDQPPAAGKKKVKETKGEKKDPNEITIAHLKCGCEGQISYDCKGPEAEEKLRQDANGEKGAKYVRRVVPVDLNQEQFDALVDITLHVGHVPDELLDAIKRYWCTTKGQNYVRSIYLRTALTREHSKTIEEGFVKRREYRVWPYLTEKPVVAEKKADPSKKVEDKPKPPSSQSLTLLPGPEAPSPSLLPGAPGDSPVTQAAQAVKGAEDWARGLLHKGLALRKRLDSTNRPTEAELKAFKDEEALWRSAVESAKIKYKHSEEAVNGLGALLDRVGPRLTQMRVHLGVS